MLLILGNIYENIFLFNIIYKNTDRFTINQDLRFLLLLFPDQKMVTSTVFCFAIFFMNVSRREKAGEICYVASPP